jgi:hypothetical protein
MVLIAVTPQLPMTIIWITCMMATYITNMMIIGTSALLMAAWNTPNTSINTDLTVDMSPFHMVITLITYTTATYTPPTATTGTNTKYSVSGRGDVR